MQISKNRNSLIKPGFNKPYRQNGILYRIREEVRLKNHYSSPNQIEICAKSASRIYQLISIFSILSIIIAFLVPSQRTNAGFFSAIKDNLGVENPLLVPPNPALWDKIRRGVVKLPEVMLEPESAQESGFDQPLISTPTPSGTWKALAILVKFSDKNASVNAGNFDTLLFSDTAGVKSLRNYYDEVSYGQLDIVTVNLPSSTGWKQMPQNHAYYVNAEFCTEYYSYPHNCQKLTEDAVAAVAAYVDFSEYDNDNDGYVDSVIVIHTGTGAEMSGNSNDIWSHKWQTRSQPFYNGVRIRSYTIQPEYWLSSGDMTIGVFAHELGHIFGLPDLYDTTHLPDGTNTTQGVGYWSLMAYGSWSGPIQSNHHLGGSPAFLDAWSRIQLGWSTATDIFGSSTRSLPNVETTAGGIFRLLPYGGGSQEYFLVENRQKIGFDAYLPGSGLLIWHIDSAIPVRYGGGANDFYCYQRENWNCPYPNHFRVALEQADGLWHLENKTTPKNWGDAGDAWPGTTNKRSFNWSATPNPSSYYATSDTRIEIINISNSGTSMSAQFNTMPSAFTKLSPLNLVSSQPTNLTLSWGNSTGAANYEVCYDTTNNNACDTAWVSSGASTSMALSGLTPNTTYYWQVKAAALVGSPFVRDASENWWRFSTGQMPSIFIKSSPLNDSTNQSLTPTLQWGTSAGVAKYEYCLDTSNNSACDGSWIDVGNTTQVSLSELSLATFYYWQVRAMNNIGTTYANTESTWWNFRTELAPYPGPFPKLAPIQNAQNVSTDPTLSWGNSMGAGYYEVCLIQTDILPTGDCPDEWVDEGFDLFVAISGLAEGTTYFWKVRALGSSGPTEADDGAWSGFTTWVLKTVYIPLILK